MKSKSGSSLYNVSENLPVECENPHAAAIVAQTCVHPGLRKDNIDLVLLRRESSGQYTGLAAEEEMCAGQTLPRHYVFDMEMTSLHKYFSTFDRLTMTSLLTVRNGVPRFLSMIRFIFFFYL